MLDRRLAWVFAIAPFVTLVGVLKRMPDFGVVPMPWSHAVGHALLLFGLMAAHAVCYAMWVEHSRNRVLVNEFLTRTWFVLFGLVIVAQHSDTGPIYLVMASAWGVAAWCTHYLVLRAQGSYRVLENLAQHGLFLLGLALMALVALAI